MTRILEKRLGLEPPTAALRDRAGLSGPRDPDDQGDAWRRDLEDIADAIDGAWSGDLEEAHALGMDDALDPDAADLADRGLMRGPVGADGGPWAVGDRMASGAAVDALMWDGRAWWLCDGLARVLAGTARHAQAGPDAAELAARTDAVAEWLEWNRPDCGGAAGKLRRIADGVRKLEGDVA